MTGIVNWALVNPLPVLLSITALAVANLWRKRKESRRRLLAVTIPLAVLTVMSIPAVVHCARGGLEWQYPPIDRRPEGMEAIVVLASGLEPDEEHPGRATLDYHSRNRCRRAAELYRQGPSCPVIACGGPVETEASWPTRAAAMRDYLVELGVAPGDIVAEDKSQSTYENAVECQHVLASRGLQRIAVVTEASHLVRAVACFRKQGVVTEGCGCNYLSTPENTGRCVYWPHPHALERWQPICHEWCGLGWYWLTGRI
jgi:uncharacterized SAM-binding protein YcdF (DUF218 family)